jgi:hypothetical protein
MATVSVNQRHHFRLAKLTSEVFFVVAWAGRRQLLSAVPVRRARA